MKLLLTAVISAAVLFIIGTFILHVNFASYPQPKYLPILATVVFLVVRTVVYKGIPNKKKKEGE